MASSASHQHPLHPHPETTPQKSREKRQVPVAACQFITRPFKRPRVGSALSSSPTRPPLLASTPSVSSTCPGTPTPGSPFPTPPPPESCTSPSVSALPDEVLIRILRFVPCARTLAHLRLVSRSWCATIDSSASLWANASFHMAAFARPIVVFQPDAPTPSAPRPQPRLALGERPGRAVLRHAAAAGNEWAALLHSALFTHPAPVAPVAETMLRGHPQQSAAPPIAIATTASRLHAITLSAPVAHALVRGAVSRVRPPAYLAALEAGVAGTREHDDDKDGVNGAKGEGAPEAPGWVGVHAAKARGHAGALVGMVRVEKKEACHERWTVTRTLVLRKPIMCAGYIGLWPMGEWLTELLLFALHKQQE